MARIFTCKPPDRAFMVDKILVWETIQPVVGVGWNLGQRFGVVHESKPYALEVDTSVLSPEACAKVIVDCIVSDA